MAEKKVLTEAERKKAARADAVRQSLRAEERADLAAASSAYTSGLNEIAKAVLSLARGYRALDSARKASESPSLARYAVAARLRPAVLQRAVVAISRDLGQKVQIARSSDLSVPDGDEKPYEKLLRRLAAASDSIEEALRDFGRELPDRPGDDAPAIVRALILSSARAAAQLNRTLGRSRSSASVHVAAVADEISSNKDVSFY